MILYVTFCTYMSLRKVTFNHGPENCDFQKPNMMKKDKKLNIF